MIALVTDEATGADTPLGCALRPEDKPYGCALTGSQGTGKCVGPDDLVLLEGRLIRAADAWDEYATSSVFDGKGWWSDPLRWPLTCALDGEGRIVQAPVRRFYRQRVREGGRRVTLSDGSQLTITDRHRLRGPDGWVATVGEGDPVCVPRRLDWPGRQLPDELVELLAWQLTEGCERSGGRRAPTASTVSITQADRRVVERARLLAERVGELHGLRMNAMPIRRTKTCWTLFIHSADWRDFLMHRGYRWGAASAEKRLPDFVMQGDLDSSRSFLRVFFAAEGHVNASHLTLEAASASRLMLEQVRALLRRFGIFAKLEPKHGRATNGLRIVRPYYRLRLAGPSLRTFLAEIGIASPEKEARLIACLEGRRPNSNTEGVYARDLLTAARDLGIPFAWITRHSGYLDTPRAGRDKAREMAARMRAAASRIEQATLGDGRPLRAATRERTATLATVNPADVLELADALEARIETEVFFAKVTRVEEVALDGWVYDFEVPEHHSFVAGGMLAHNTSVMAQSCADDAQDQECCLIVLDPKRDLADKALSVIPRHRRVWILDLAEPEIGINPLLIPGRPDAVADAVVEGFRDTNEAGAIMASSDRYLRQAAIGALVLALEERRMPTMGDLYRLLLPREDTMRRRVAELCDTHGELAFTSVFFGESLPTDLQDARSQTTVKLDAPRNKIEALLGVPSVNRMLHHPFQRSLHDIIAERDALVVRGASGSIGEGNAIKVLTWLLRCLDAALSDQQQKPEADRIRVALKVDEAHLLLSPTFARMLAVHRSAGLEAMCAWQQLSQIKDLAVREATTNLLQNRVVFRMNNPEDARAEIGVMMSAYADVLHGSREARELTKFQPDMLVNLDVFYALCSWVAGGRRADAFVGRTIPPCEDPALIAHHERAQRERGAFVVERLPNLVAPRSWVRRAAVVGVDVDADNTAAEPGPAETAKTSAVPGAPTGEDAANASSSEPAESETDGREPDHNAASSEHSDAAATTPPPAPPEPESQPPVRRVRIDDEPFDPARTGNADSREVTDSQPVGTHISLERSYTELAIDQPLRLKYEPARSLADEKALARVDARAKQILAVLHDAGFLLAPQIGRRFWPDGTNERNIQRALTRLAELGLVERFRIITADGGTQPFIYQLTKAGFEYAQTQRGPHGPFIHPEAQWRERKVSDPRYVLHNLHATAWVLAFERAAGRFVRNWHGPSHPLTRPRVPRVKEEREWVNLGPRHLKPPPNMAIHGLKFPTNVDVARQEFEGLEADALIELAIPVGNGTRRVDVFVEMDRTRRPSKNSPKFRRYDHFITGWSTLLDRYAEALKERPIVVFVCEDGDQALDFLKLADTQATGAIGVKGTEIAEWQHPARERMFFVAERDLHSGTLRALRLPARPPKVRATLGEPADPQPEQVSILPRRLLGASRRRSP